MEENKMEILKIEEIEFRNKDGKVLEIEQQIEVDGVLKMVKVLPFIEDEFEMVVSKINSKNEAENREFINKVLVDKMVEPAVNSSNVKFMKPILKAKLLKAILKATGIGDESIKEAKIN